MAVDAGENLSTRLTNALAIMPAGTNGTRASIKTALTSCSTTILALSPVNLLSVPQCVDINDFLVKLAAYLAESLKDQANL